MGSLRLFPSQPLNKSLSSLDAEEIFNAHVSFPLKKNPVESGKKNKNKNLFCIKKTTAGLEVIKYSLSAATALTSHLPPLPLKTLDTLPSSSAENRS